MFSPPPPPHTHTHTHTYTDPGGGGQKSTFSEHGHVAYQFKGNQKCSNMLANILPSDLLPGPGGQKVKIQVMLHIKLEGIRNAATW